METERYVFAAKQYSDFQVGNNFDAPVRAEFETVTLRNENGTINCQFKYSSPIIRSADEPIDLSTINNKEDEIKTEEIHIVNNAPPITAASTTFANCPDNLVQYNQQHDYFPKRKRRKTRYMYTNDGQLVLLTDAIVQPPPSFSPNKQMEVIKAAKSLFSKRTRTLYHWMYPNAAKQQIKTAVASSWETLGEAEKDFYISQVMGRFGFPQSSLMINPQLDSIKELPPISANAENESTSQELESAISSILPDNGSPEMRKPLTFEEFEELNEKSRKRRGRPKRIITNRINYVQDFQDDPELSQELEKFAVKFNLNKI